MAKHDFLTPKAIANRIKSKGLQRLRWYCQICEKQCRDENGFKCHCASESHQRQMELFSQNPSKFMDTYTSQFKNDFLALLKRRFGERRVFANMVYQEYIEDKQHTHMNATIWATLNDFVKYLGREGICTVEDTERGWFISYIDRSPEVLARLAAREKKEKMELDEEERNKKLIEKQVERAKVNLSPENIEKQESSVLVLPKDPERKMTFNLKKSTNSQLFKPSIKLFEEVEEKAPEVMDGGADIAQKHEDKISMTTQTLSKRKFSVSVGSSQEPEEVQEHHETLRDDWLQKDIVVRILNQKLAQGAYYKKKGIVMNVIRTYIAELKMSDSGDVLRLDQEHLNTVIPDKGGLVRVVNGLYRDELAIVESLDDDKTEGLLRILHGTRHGEQVKVAYQNFCKVLDS